MEDPIEVIDAVEDPGKPGGRQNNFMKVEDHCLLHAYGRASEDAIVGANQSGKQFCKLLKKNYDKFMDIQINKDNLLRSTVSPETLELLGKIHVVVGVSDESMQIG